MDGYLLEKINSVRHIVGECWFPRRTCGDGDSGGAGEGGVERV